MNIMVHICPVCSINVIKRWSLDSKRLRSLALVVLQQHCATGKENTAGKKGYLK